MNAVVQKITAADFPAIVERTNALTKAQLVEVYRKLNAGKVGDTARTNIDQYRAMVLSFNPQAVAEALDGGATKLLAWAHPPVAQEQVPFAAAPAKVEQAEAVQQLQSALQALLAAPKAELDPAAVEQLVDTKLAPFAAKLGELAGGIDAKLQEVANSIKPQVKIETVVVNQATGEEVKLASHTRPEFKRVLQLAAAGKNVLLVGPAGCGKTHLAGQVAEALGRRFGAISCTAGASESQLTGWLLPTGEGGRFEYNPSVFVDLYENGGVFLLDEIDAADPNMLLVINQALANGHFFLPQRRDNPEVKRHKDFVCIAAANTYGHGGDMVYAGRERLDGATLDRFRIGITPLDYDAELEEQLVDSRLLSWGREARARIAELRLRRVLSTRFLIDATDMLRAGWSHREVVDSFFSDWSAEERAKVSSHV